MKKVYFITFIIVLLTVCSAITLLYIVYSSLPMLNGEKIILGLKHPVIINRDQNGTVLIQAKNRIDASLALGFVHGQDRFFQMDLLRRSSAGELSELFGKELIDFDKERRLHNLKQVAKNIFANLSTYEQQLLKAYTIGVNSGIRNLSLQPFEYFLLSVSPRLWQEEDSILVILAIYFSLQDNVIKKNLVRWLTLNNCGDTVYKFLFKNGSVWDAALDKSNTKLLSLPQSSELDYILQKREKVVSYSPNLKEEKFGIGSNQWALSGKFTKDGKSILACDLHLNLMVPNIWYHAALEYNKNDEKIFTVGATLPGTPLVITGSNGHVSWGLTNAELDTSDLILLDNNDQISQRQEIIKVKGDNDFLTIIDESPYGPIIPGTYMNQRFALKWVAHDNQSCNLGFIDLESDKSVDSAILTSQKIRGPILNLMLADKTGNIGWTLVGTLPKRTGFNGELPIKSSSNEAKTLGIQDAKSYPTIKTRDGFLFTANNRTLNSSFWEPVIGHGTYINPIRAFQIKEFLLKVSQTTELEMLKLQFSDEAIFFNRWHSLMLSLIDNKNSTLYNILKSWDHRASSESKAYPLIREFRQTVLEMFIIKILQPVLDQYSDFSLAMFDFEEPVWMIINSDICDVLSKDMISCKLKLNNILNEIDHKYKSLGYPTWGEINQTTIQHPLSNVSILLEKFFDMPKRATSGDFFVPKVLFKNVGASLRIVIKPGDENNGIYQSPTGQASNPLSPFYNKGYEEWMNGQTFPLTIKIENSIGQITLIPG